MQKFSDVIRCMGHRGRSCKLADYAVRADAFLQKPEMTQEEKNAEDFLFFFFLLCGGDDVSGFVGGVGT